MTRYFITRRSAFRKLWDTSPLHACIKACHKQQHATRKAGLLKDSFAFVQYLFSLMWFSLETWRRRVTVNCNFKRFCCVAWSPTFHFKSTDHRKPKFQPQAIASGLSKPRESEVALRLATFFTFIIFVFYATRHSPALLRTIYILRHTKVIFVSSVIQDLRFCAYGRHRGGTMTWVKVSQGVRGHQ